MQLAGKWTADFIRKEGGSQQRALSSRVLPSGLSSTWISVAPTGGWSTMWGNRTRATAGYCTRPGRRQRGWGWQRQ